MPAGQDRSQGQRWRGAPGERRGRGAGPLRWTRLTAYLLQARLHLARPLVALLGLLLERLDHHLVEPRVHPGLLRGWPDDALRHAPREHLVEHDPQREDIRPMVHLLGCAQLLGRHVAQRAHRLVAGREPRRGLVVHQLGETEVGDLHVAALVDQDVLRLDVPVYHSTIVGVLEGGADFRHDGQRLGRLELPFGQQLSQVGAVHVLHHDPRQVPVLIEVVHRHDARMGQAGERLGLAHEALLPARDRARRWEEDLDRHPPIQPRLPRGEHGAHASPPQAPEQLVAGQSRSQPLPQRVEVIDGVGRRAQVLGTHLVRVLFLGHRSISAAGWSGAVRPHPRDSSADVTGRGGFLVDRRRP